MRRGYTLVELVLVIAILSIMMVISVMTLNSMGLLGKSNDTRRKSDMKLIKTSFEEYFNDKGNYPTFDLVVGQIGATQLMDPINCGTTFFDPWLHTWPCDPDGHPYYISVEEPKGTVDAPHWFKIFTKLQNGSDKDIPDNWGGADVHYGNGEYNADEVNYGVSSSNVNWYDLEFWVGCSDPLYSGCFIVGSDPTCKNAQDGCHPPDKCYTRYGCTPVCQVPSCGN